MKNEKNQYLSRAIARWARWCAAFGLLGLPAGSVLASVEFHPRSEISTTWVDNITLVGDADPTKESDLVSEVNPGFVFVQKAKRFNSSFVYTMQNLFFKNDSDRNTTFHQGEAGFNAEVLSDYFYVDGSGSYSQQIVDPRAPVNLGNLFGVQNQADALAAQISPNLRHEFELARVELRYTRGMVDFKAKSAAQGRIEDADTETHSAILASPDEYAQVTWEGRYESQEVKYELSPVYRFDHANGELGVLLGKPLRLIGRYGMETDVTVDSTKGGFDQKTWEAGFRWLPSVATRVEAFVGDHSYGKTYNGSLHHEARLANWDLTYSEGPLTQAQELIIRPISADPLQQRVVQADDATFAQQTSAVFLRQVAEAVVHLKGQRTEIDLFATDYRRHYLDGRAGDEHQRAFAVEIQRSLSSQSQFIVGGRVAQTDLDTGEDFRDSYVHMDMRRTFGQRTSASIGATHLIRSGLLPYRVNSVTASITGQF